MGKDDLVVYNLALVTDDTNRNLTGVLKEHKSTIDFLKHAQPGGISDEYVKHMSEKNEALQVPHQLVDRLKIDKDGIFTERGITFGVEICLDHLQKRLVQTPGSNKVQVQIITSAG